MVVRMVIESTKDLEFQPQKVSTPQNLLEASRFTPTEIVKFRMVQLLSIVSLFFTTIALFLPLVHFRWFGEYIIDYLSIALFFQSSTVSPTVGFPMAFVFILSIPSVFLSGMLFHVTYHKKYLSFQAFMQAFLTFPTMFFLIVLETALHNKTRTLFDVGVTQVDPTRFLGSALGEAPWLFLMSVLLSILANFLYDVRMKDKIESYYLKLRAMLIFSDAKKSREYT